MSPLQVGSIVTATRGTAVCSPGERGVVYEIYVLAGRPGCSVIFAGGAYDGFSPEEVDLFLRSMGVCCEAVAGYRFSNVLQLARDFDAGYFAPAFAIPLPDQLKPQLETTLAFEQIVDAILAFRRLLHAAVGDITVGERLETREALAQLLNELYPSVREAAEQRFAARLARSYPSLLPADPAARRALLADALDDYRRALRQIPIRGIGVLV